jgi:hypothetical protein
MGQHRSTHPDRTAGNNWQDLLNAGGHYRGPGSILRDRLFTNTCNNTTEIFLEKLETGTFREGHTALADHLRSSVPF